jgi:8-oxo-dGTP pyrophosphatase MutT (NUDIX family)
MELLQLHSKGLIKDCELSQEKETVLEAAIRENKEESGITISPDNIFGRIEFQGMKKEIRVILFLAETKMNPLSTENGELNSFIWIPVNILLNGPIHHSNQRVIDYLMQFDKDAKVLPGTYAYEKLQEWLKDKAP